MYIHITRNHKSQPTDPWTRCPHTLTITHYPVVPSQISYFEHDNFVNNTKRRYLGTRAATAVGNTHDQIVHKDIP